MNIRKRIAALIAETKAPALNCGTAEQIEIFVPLLRNLRHTLHALESIPAATTSGEKPTPERGTADALLVEVLSDLESVSDLNERRGLSAQLAVLAKSSALACQDLPGSIRPLLCQSLDFARTNGLGIPRGLWLGIAGRLNRIIGRALDDSRAVVIWNAPEAPLPRLLSRLLTRALESTSYEEKRSLVASAEDFAKAGPCPLVENLLTLGLKTDDLGILARIAALVAEMDADGDKVP